MKHSDWLRLNQEGEQICAVFRQPTRLSVQETNPPSILAALLIGSGRLQSDLATRASGRLELDTE